MAFSENLPSLGLGAWGAPLPPSFSGAWFSDAFARDTDALTKALQQSLSAHQPETATVFPEPVPSSTSDHETAPKRARNQTPSGKISKRKSRATKRSPTTFIMADPANFREMVQRVTGVRFAGGGSQFQVWPVLKPEPQRAADRVLDTSAFLVGRIAEGSGKASSYAPDCAGFDSEDFPIFPTLESWHAI